MVHCYVQRFGQNVDLYDNGSSPCALQSVHNNYRALAVLQQHIFDVCVRQANAGNICYNSSLPNVCVGHLDACLMCRFVSQWAIANVPASRQWATLTSQWAEIVGHWTRVLWGFSGGPRSPGFGPVPRTFGPGRSLHAFVT